MKWRSSFLLKLFTGYVLLVVFTTVIVGVLAHYRIAADSIAEIENTLEHQAQFLRDMAIPVWQGTETADALQADVQELGRRTKSRLTVIDATGIVLADSHEDATQMENHGTRPEVVRSLETGRGTAMRYSHTLKQQMLYLALPVYLDEQHVGFVRTSLPLSAVNERLSALRENIILGMVLALLFSLPLGWLFARRVTMPLSSMTKAARAISKGDYEQQLRVTSHDEIGVLAEALNVMSQSLAERLETIARDRNQLQAMLASMAEGVIAVDREERIVHINAVAERICRTSAAASTGQRTWEAIRIPQFTEAIRQAIADGLAVEREIVIAGVPQDQLFDLDVTPWRDRSGEVVGAVAVLHDVTRLRKLEQLRQEFVANASHELKSPITAIRGFAETMLDDPQMDSETRRKFTQSILEDTHRLGALLRDMLMLSSLEQRDLVGELASVNLRELVSEVVRTLHTKADANGVTLNADLGDRSVSVNGQAETLATAVRNVVDNALNYTPRGGSVLVTLSSKDSYAFVTVSDTGVGIAPEHHERIFERFYRVDKARSRELGGTGLGLAIVKHTILTHGGGISVSSTPEQGSTFTIRLPLPPSQ